VIGVRRAALLIGGLLVCVAAEGVARAQSQRDQLQRTQPPGFDDLLAAREISLELYVDGQQAGSVTVFQAPGSIRFAKPEELITLLPPVRDEPAVAAALRQSLPSNAGLSCSPKPRKDCGRLEPEVVGVILSRDANRVDLFLAPSVRGRPRVHLPDPPGGPLTVAGTLDLQYALGRHGLTYTLRQRAVAGLGRAHLALDTIITDRTSELDGAYLRRVGDRVSLTGGLFRSSRYTFAFIDRFLGVSVASTNETRIDRATLNDTLLVIDGSLSGRVEIYRDAVLLDTQPLSPGQATLDTSRLPGGVYPVTLKIIDASGERTETRLFARAANLPASGETQFFLEAGANVPFRSDAGFLPHVLSPAIRGGVDRRMSPQIAISGRMEGSKERQLIELGGTYLRRNWRASATAAATASGERAAALSVSGSIAKVSWSLDARAVEGGKGFSFDPERGLGRSYRQVTAFGGWNSRRLSLHVGTFWRREADGQSSWSVFPRLLWTIVQGRGRTWQFDASGNLGQSEWAARIGIRASLFGGRSSTSLFGGTDVRRREGATGFEPIARTDWNRSLDWGVNSVALRGALLHDDGRTQGQFGGDLTNPRFQLTANATIEQELERSALFGRASTQFGFADGRLAFGSGGFTGAGIIAEAPGAPPDARFAVRMGRVSGRPFPGEGPVFISTQPFSQASIGINALGSGATLDTKSEAAIFFPGTVKRLVRGSSRTTVIFGRLVDLSGAPLGGASITSEFNSAESDEAGNFQLEVGSSELPVRTAGGGQCTANLSDLDMSAAFTDAGALVCKPPE
jgi:hypothetical protein